jgi:acyl-CoA synthetase (NDP forming)
MVLLGPNHLGFANLVDHAPVTPIPDLPQEAGSVALLSQSGASSAAMASFANISGAGLSYMVTLGNEAMITAGHVLDFLVDDEHTKAIAIFLETIRDPEVFRKAARRAAAAGKPVVVLKAGSSELAARTAAAHTGALVGDDKTIDAVFRDLGVIRVDSIEDMLITAGTAAKLGRLPRPGIGVVSISGGTCDILADRAQDLDLGIPAFSEDTTAKLGEIMPDYGTVHNPLDVTGAAIIDPSIFTRAVETISADESIGVVAVINGLPWQDDGKPVASQPLLDAIGAGIQNAGGPAVLVNQVLEPITERSKAIMADAQVPHTIPGLRQAVVALRNLGWWSEVTRGVDAAPARHRDTVPVPDTSARRGPWSEAAARDLVSRAGIPVVPAEVVNSGDEAVKVAAELEGPVALKVVSPDILHKSDIGGVRLGVTGDEAVRKAHDEIIAAAPADASVDGVLVSPMRSGGAELLVGVVRDPQWGPMLAVAIGGVFVEVLGDSSVSPLPVSPPRARELVERLRGAALLRGARGTPAADLDALAEVIARVGDLALALGDDLESLEINPLRVSGDVVEALDAVVTWRDA